MYIIDFNINSMKRTAYCWKKRVIDNMNRKKWRQKVRFRRRKTEMRRRSLSDSALNVSSVASEYDRQIPAPPKFSMIDNPVDTVTFVEKLYRCLEKRKSVFIDLSNIVYITYDAVLVLLSMVYQFKRAAISFNGNFPHNYSCASRLCRR